MRESDRHMDSLKLTDARHLELTDARHLKTVSPSASAASETVLPALAITSEPQKTLPHEKSDSLTTPIASGGSAMSETLRDRVLSWLQRHVPDTRLQHILRVEQMSVALAQCHHVNPEQAAQAGLMHDLAKFFKPQRLLQMAEAEGLALDPVERANPHLLHAAIGAIVARDEFGVCDGDVLDAIRHHTLGQPEMSALSCVVFLADSLEPGRGETPELEALRQMSRQNLYRAVWQTCDASLRYLLASSHLIHPRMVLTRNWAMAADRKAL